MPHPPGILCAKCGYSLAGLEPGRCPECGGSVWTTGKRIPTKLRALMVVPPAIASVAAVAAGIGCALTNSAYDQLAIAAIVPLFAGTMNGLVTAVVASCVLSNRMTNKVINRQKSAVGIALSVLASGCIAAVLTFLLVIGAVWLGRELNYIRMC